MAIKQSSVSMPMASAGIIGYSPDVKIGGRQLEPKVLIAATVLLVIIVKLAGIIQF
jgi:preprotein translocase subunit Sec61beta